MGSRYYRIITLNNPSGISQNLTRKLIKDDNDEILSISYYVAKKAQNSSLYTGRLAESLETIELARYIATCRKNNKFPSISNAFENGFAFDGDNKNFLGYTNALIEIKFRTDYVHRIDYYSKGFYFNGIKYVRYKRSASSARNGKCLFIMEDLLNKHMQKWGDCGLTIDKIDDLTSWEAYRGLTLSSIESTISLPYDSILILKDRKCEFVDNVSTPFAKEPTSMYPIKNTIWDGEGLLDDSVFSTSDNPNYNSESCSMLFLRGRFFKTCGFRTNLQKWFDDNNITSISQLNGFTLAKSPKDIKLVITESSLKYCTFVEKEENDYLYLQKALTGWITGQGISITAKYKIKSTDLLFGIVKTNHPTKYYNGKLVRANYQLLNTLPLSVEDTKELLRPSLEYLCMAKKSPLFFREFLNCSTDDISLDLLPESEELDIQTIETNLDGNAPSDISQYKAYFINELIQLTNTISGTKLYTDYRAAVLSNFRTQLKKGHILIEGTLATLFGNPAEFLYCTLKQNADYELGSKLHYTVDGVNIISDVLTNNEIYCSHFKNQETLTCARNPHITMGNILLAENNTSINFYSEYFKLSPEIVCVNAVNFNLQQRLNGADYDSDTMLITNNKTLVKCTQKAVPLFPTPINTLEPEKKKINPREEISDQLCEIDRLISDDKTGQIINLSQELNSLIWNSVSNIELENQIAELLSTDFEGKYYDVCRLAILSNISLDRAKRIYKIDINETLKEIQLNEKVYRTHPFNGSLFIEERPIYLQKLLAIKPSDYMSDVYSIYNFIYGEQRKKVLISKRKLVTTPSPMILCEFGDNIELYQYDLSDEDSGKHIVSIYTINNHATHNCTMNHLYEIVTNKSLEREIDKKMEESKHPSKSLVDLICRPKKYLPAEKYCEDIKEIVKIAFNEQRKIANDRSYSKEDKHMLRCALIEECVNSVDAKLAKYHLHSDYLIYLLLNNIDQNTLLTKEDKENKLVGYSSLLLSCICSHTYEGKHVFFEMVKEKALIDHTVPNEYLQEDPNGGIHIYGIPHSIKYIN